jgi:hypothetical protein
MAIEEVNQELWELAKENVSEQQEEAFDALFDEAVEQHLKGECRDCEDGLCSRCEQWIAFGIENWQERQFDDQAEASGRSKKKSDRDPDGNYDNRTKIRNAVRSPRTPDFRGTEGVASKS